MATFDKIKDKCSSGPSGGYHWVCVVECAKSFFALWFSWAPPTPPHPTDMDWKASEQCESQLLSDQILKSNSSKYESCCTLSIQGMRENLQTFHQLVTTLALLATVQLETCKMVQVISYKVFQRLIYSKDFLSSVPGGSEFRGVWPWLWVWIWILWLTKTTDTKNSAGGVYCGGDKHLLDNLQGGVWQILQHWGEDCWW